MALDGIGWYCMVFDGIRGNCMFLYSIGPCLTAYTPAFDRLKFLTEQTSPAEKISLFDDCKYWLTSINPFSVVSNFVSESHLGAEIDVTKKLNWEFILFPF